MFKSVIRKKGENVFDGSPERLNLPTIYHVLLVFSGAICAGFASYRSSVTFDEAGHVTAGIAYWQYGAWHVYPHNPPFAKLCLSAPPVLLGASLSPHDLPTDTLRRTEIPLAQKFALKNPESIHGIFASARYVSLASYVATGLLISMFAGYWYTGFGRTVAVAVWAFHPMNIAMAGLATPDMISTLMAVLTIWLLLIVRKRMDVVTSVGCGIALGLAQTSKFTLLLLYFPILAMLLSVSFSYRRRFFCGIVLFAVSWLVMTLIYLPSKFDRSKEAKVVSKVGKTLHEILPLPISWASKKIIPSGYLYGVDRQLNDAEGNFPNYFCGYISRNGWWSYYAFVICAKTPLLTLALFFWATIQITKTSVPREFFFACLLFPMILVIAAHFGRGVSFSRYLLPAGPFCAILIGYSVACLKVPSRLVRLLVNIAIVLSGVLHHPHYLGAFNIISGGAERMWPFVISSEIDWGQDVLRLERHLTTMTDESIHVAVYSPFMCPYPSLDTDLTQLAKMWGPNEAIFRQRVPSEPQIGKLFISVTLINLFSAEFRPTEDQFDVASNSQKSFCKWLKQREPEKLIGASILQYNFDEQAISEWRAFLTASQLRD